MYKCIMNLQVWILCDLFPQVFLIKYAETSVLLETSGFVGKSWTLSSRTSQLAGIYEPSVSSADK